MASGLISGVGITPKNDYITVIEKLVSSNTFNVNDWIALPDRVNYASMIMFRNPLVITGQNIYTFEGKDGYYMGNLNYRALSSGYRFKFIMFIGFLPTFLGRSVTDKYEGFTDNQIKDILENSGCKRYISGGTEFQTSEYELNNLCKKSNLANRYCSKTYNILDGTVVNPANNNTLYGVKYDDLNPKVISNLRVSEQLLGRNEETIALFNNLQVLPIPNNNNYRALFFEDYKDEKYSRYHTGEGNITSDKVRIFKIRWNTVLNENQPCIVPKPWIVLGQSCRLIMPDNNKVYVGCYTLTFVGVEAI